MALASAFFPARADQNTILNAAISVMKESLLRPAKLNCTPPIRPRRLVPLKPRIALGAIYRINLKIAFIMVVSSFFLQGFERSTCI
jgi:hypothetical protein